MDILVAEDSQSVCVMYKTTLESRGHAVTITTNGIDCIKEYVDRLRTIGSGANPFDAVVLDYDIPRMKGIDVAKQILQLRPNQRIIFATAYGNLVLHKLGDLQRDKKFELLEKPFSPQIIINQIEGSSSLRRKKLAGFVAWDGHTGLSDVI
jgi:two-component system cell cycle response regulator CpdR